MDAEADADESTTRYEPCWYVGGFKGMKASAQAALALSPTRFSLRRPRTFFSRGVRAVWANWSAVTNVIVADGDEGVELSITTKARGMGTMVLPDTNVEAVWEVLDQLADLKERFHDPLADDGEPGSDDEGTDIDPNAEEGDPVCP